MTYVSAWQLKVISCILPFTLKKSDCKEEGKDNILDSKLRGRKWKKSWRKRAFKILVGCFKTFFPLKIFSSLKCDFFSIYFKNEFWSNLILKFFTRMKLANISFLSFQSFIFFMILNSFFFENHPNWLFIRKIAGNSAKWWYRFCMLHIFLPHWVISLL